jgi:16S rRNA (guanine966-N2)-methyltransferase
LNAPARRTIYFSCYILAVRIISGTLGGRRLRAPRGLATRPTADKVRQALFDILGDVGGARVLDLYAGTGALALEAMSRGAAAATLVDKSADAARCIEANAAALGVPVRVLRADAAAALARLAREPERFDLVFLDPPYALDVAPVLAALPPLLAAAARVIVEHDRRAAPAERHGPLALADRRRWGDTEVSFYSP